MSLLPERYLIEGGIPVGGGLVPLPQRLEKRVGVPLHREEKEPGEVDEGRLGEGRAELQEPLEDDVRVRQVGQAQVPVGGV